MRFGASQSRSVVVVWTEVLALEKILADMISTKCTILSKVRNGRVKIGHRTTTECQKWKPNKVALLNSKLLNA